MSGLWLAIETATDVASVAVGSTDHLRAARSVTGARRHSARLVPLVHEVLLAAAARLDELAGIVVGDGPGSFTGLRIGWAAAKGLAHDRGLPLRAVPSLMAAAHAAAGGEVGPVAASFNALRGQIFGAVYAFPPRPARVETLVPPGLHVAGALEAASPVRPIATAHDGALASLPPLAGSLLALLDREGAARELDAAAEPAYGRPAEAQAKWEARHGRPLPHSSR